MMILDSVFTYADIVNMKTKTISTRLDEDDLMVLDELAEFAGLDRSGMTRSLVRRGLKEMRLENALTAYSEQRVTLSRAAEMAGISTWDFLSRMAASGVVLNYDLEEFEEDMNVDL